MTVAYTFIIEAEKNYVDRLKVLELNLTHESNKNESVQLLEQVQALLCLHYEHYKKLISSDDQQETFENLLMQWASNMQALYEKYIECVTKLLDSCQEISPPILWQPSLNSTHQQKNTVTIQAPLQQLETYKYLFKQEHQTNLISEPTLQQLYQTFDELMNRIPSSLKVNSELLHTQIDCTKTIDFDNGDHVENFQLPAFSEILLCNRFNCVELDKAVQLVLTTDKLVLCSVEAHQKLSLLYTPICIDEIMIRPAHSNVEDQACFQLWINKQSIFTMRSDSTEVCNMWLSHDADSNTTREDAKLSSWKTLLETAARHSHQFIPTDKALHTKMSRPTIRTEDIFTLSSSYSEQISPLVSSDEELEDQVDSTKGNAQVEGGTGMSGDRNLMSLAEQKPLPPIAGSTNSPSLSAKPSIALNSQLIPNRKHSLSNPPIPTRMLSSGIISPDNRVSSIRAVSSYQSIGNVHQQHDLQVPLSSQNDNGIPPTKRLSFMRSVIGAISNRASLRPKKSSSKISINEIYSPQANSITKSLSAVSLSQQKIQSENQHLHLPSDDFSIQKPRSTSIPFSNTLGTSEQCSPASTPSLSRTSSTGGSVTPIRHTPSSSTSEAFDLPSENLDANAIKAILYSNDKCQVFRWKDESWYAVEGDCLLEVRQTHASRFCVTIRTKNLGQLYLNAWILPDTFIIRTTETDLSLSLNIARNQTVEVENYLLHCQSKTEADRLASLLEQLHRESVRLNNMMSHINGALKEERSDSLSNPVMPVISEEEIARSFKLVMQCKCKLYVQNASSNWSSFGSVYMKVSQNHTTKRMHISMESHKGEKTTQLVSAMIQSRNVERLSPKRVTFLLVDELERNSVVYMVQVREEATSDKIIEYTKTKNAENGW
ncbi:hypothetical protein BD560DRAFT_424769 [Blakeslea trispora]|nr:hypothetical protein BD560DRAFT_424769 [Blakeslea trispora]